MEMDYRSRDLVSHSGVFARYDGESHYVSAHVGFGKSWALTGSGRLETYAQWLWTRQGSDATTLSTGERLKFSDSESSRLRAGGRFIRALTPAVSGFVGLAWEHEFDGKVKATTNGLPIDAPKLKGNSGMLELGVTTSPSAPLTLGASIQGYAGKREGVRGGVEVNYRF
jgi:outer membrane autotransporter protein